MKNDVSKRKKTSKEKRALIGALCIAAAVAAGSTFAWFSSVDEVTNRLSANAAYDVSIIETFTPPTNWIPGQKVNKDTAAVNTGNIPAFVKQKLEGKIQITMESAESTIDLADKTKTYIELTEDEIDSVEAGGYLAWASNGSTVIGVPKGGEMTDPTKQCYLGEISAVHTVDYIGDADLYSVKQFTPPATGDYIFRRVIDVNDKKDTAEYGTETYEYSGFHYDATKGKYYKIKVINGLQPGEDGILQAAPTVYYGVEKQDIRTLPLRYETAGEEHYFKYVPDSTGAETKVEYTEVTSQTINSNNAEFEVYAFGSTSYCVVIDKGSSDLTVGDVYSSAVPLGTKIGHIVGSVSEKKYVEDKSTPQRLVATYEVGKSDDVFIGTPTDLSDPTADSYDKNLRDIAYSDYLVAKVAYDNEKAKYDLDMAAYNASKALLTALKKNEEALTNRNTAIDGLGIFDGTISAPDFTCTDTTVDNQSVKNDAAELFSNEISKMNSAFGSYVPDSNDVTQNQYVLAFLNAVSVYKSTPTDENWNSLLTKYQTVTKHFTAVNNKVSDFEAAIVEKWEAAGLNAGVTGKFNNIAGYTPTGNISNDAITVKYAADQLKKWEGRLAEYQQRVNKYFTDLSEIQKNDDYTLQDLRPLTAAYKDAVGAKKKKYKTDAAHDEHNEQSGRASKIEDDGEVQVSSKYYITVNGDVRNYVELHSTGEVPIKNTISENGYAGAAPIPYITGQYPFMLGEATADAATPPLKENVDDLYDKYIKAKNLYNKYSTEHTNQDTNDDIVIYINLANVCKADADNTGEINKNEWKLSPTLKAGDTYANFYYTSILGPGEQTSILVDSLELSGDTSNVAFKEFDFDLNVTVDSSQVVVSEDGGYYESTAVNANDAFKVKPSEPKYRKETAAPVKDAIKVDWT